MKAGDKVWFDGKTYTVIRVILDRAYIRDSSLRHRSVSLSDLTPLNQMTLKEDQ